MGADARRLHPPRAGQGWHGGTTPTSLHSARDETATLTEEIAKVEREIDERVAELYGAVLEKARSA